MIEMIDVVRDNLIDVETMRDVYGGSKLLTEYIEPFAEETTESLDYRRRNLTLVNYLRRTIRNSVNLIFRRPPEFDGAIDEVFEIKSIELYRNLTKELLLTGEVFLVTDSDKEAYQYIIARDSVINYFEEDQELVLFTSSSVEEYFDGNKIITQEVIRSWKLQDSKCIIEVYIDSELNEIIETDFNYIPIVRISADRESDIPLLDLAKQNIQWLNRRSELSRYLRISACPVPVFYGVQGKTNIVVGVDKALTFTSKDEGGFEWVEITGNATDKLQEDLREIERAMAETAVSLISKKDVAKNAVQVSAEIAEDESFLTLIANKIEEGINKSLIFYCDIMNLSPILVTVNKDYTSSILNIEQVDSLLNLYLNGVITQDQLLEMLVQGEYLPQKIINTGG
jgi:hypothetical protein